MSSAERTFKRQNGVPVSGVDLQELAVVRKAQEQKDKAMDESILHSKAQLANQYLSLPPESRNESTTNQVNKFLHTYFELADGD